MRGQKTKVPTLLHGPRQGFKRSAPHKPGLKEEITQITASHPPETLDSLAEAASRLARHLELGDKKLNNSEALYQRARAYLRGTLPFNTEPAAVDRAAESLCRCLNRVSRRKYNQDFSELDLKEQQKRASKVAKVIYKIYWQQFEA
jgi:hypothetical protein